MNTNDDCEFFEPMTQTGIGIDRGREKMAALAPTERTSVATRKRKKPKEFTLLTRWSNTTTMGGDENGTLI